MSEKPIQKTIPNLIITGGIARKTAVDEHGCKFIEFEVDWLAGEDVDCCHVCEIAIEEGWLCLDGGEVYCYEHVMEIQDEAEEDTVTV